MYGIYSAYHKAENKNIPIFHTGKIVRNRISILTSAPDPDPADQNQCDSMQTDPALQH